MKHLSWSVLILLLGVSSALGNVTGDPVADGWIFGGHSLANGVYVRGSANYGYNTYGLQFTVSPGSNLEISDGGNSWLAGDTILGVGGQFAGITPAEAGWTAFTGGAVNSITAVNIKLQAKFGTDYSTFSTSTIAPAAGNGAGSLGTNGGTGAVQVRTSAYNTALFWAAGSGTLQLLQSASHIERNGAAAPDADVTRLMWIWDGSANRVGTWEILLNTSLVQRLDTTFQGPWPSGGNKALMTVQYDDNAYTDALQTLTGIPAPGAALLGFIGLGLVGWLKRRFA
jgi:hypothetical protein